LDLLETDNGACRMLDSRRRYTPFRGTRRERCGEGGQVGSAIAWWPGESVPRRSRTTIIWVGLDLMATFCLPFAGVSASYRRPRGEPTTFDSRMSPVFAGRGKLSEQVMVLLHRRTNSLQGGGPGSTIKGVFNCGGDDGGPRLEGLAVDSNLGWKGGRELMCGGPQLF